jgi:ribonucleotide reductase beta subunit family protein with ferritin-like domain
VEDIFFSGSLYSVLWLKKRSLMPGLTFPRKLISCDGDLRSDFACLLYSYPENELPEERVQAII